MRRAKTVKRRARARMTLESTVESVGSDERVSDLGYSVA